MPATSHPGLNYQSDEPRSPAFFKAAFAIALVLVTGTLGYKFIEGWPLIDGFYMTVITITTIGFKEVHDLSIYGQLFTIFIIVSGIGVVGYFVITSTAMLIEGELQQILTRRRSMKAIEKIRDHFIVCGFGRMGSFICEELHHRGIPFVVVEQRTEVQDKVMDAGFLLAPGDATEEETLVRAGIANARGLVSVLDSDAQNVYVVLTARELKTDLEIIARAGEESAHKKLIRAGASRVISPYKIGGMRLVLGILKPEVMNFIEVAMDYRQFDIELEQVLVSEGSEYDGKQLIDTDIRKELNLIVISIVKQDGNRVFNPGPYATINGNDTLIAMGERKNLTLLEKKAGINGSKRI